MAGSHLQFAVFLSYLYFVVAAKTTEGYAEISDEYKQDLLDNLLARENGYDSRVPPQGKNGLDTPIEVNSTMYILDISNVDDTNSQFTMEFYFRQKWNDPRLQFESAVNRVTFLQVEDTESLWKPDLFFIEEIEGKMHTLVVPNKLMRIYPNGNILYSVRLGMTCRCAMDLSYFPLDTQNCNLSVESFAFKKDKVILTWEKFNTAVSKSEDIRLPNFQLMNVSFTEETLTYLFGEYSSIKVHLTFTRKLEFFVTKLYVPFTILVIVSWLSFWIRPKSLALRLSLLLSILFIMLALTSDLNSYVPAVPYTKSIDVWMAFCISLVFGALLEFILVSRLGNVDDEKQRSRNDPESGAPMDKLKNGEKLDVVMEKGRTRFSSKFVSRNLNHIVQWTGRADSFSFYLFSLSFLVFNIIYWSVYGPGN